MTWGSDTPQDLVLDREKLAEALKKVSKLGHFVSLVSNMLSFMLLMSLG